MPPAVAATAPTAPSAEDCTALGFYAGAQAQRLPTLAGAGLLVRARQGVVAADKEVAAAAAKQRVAQLTAAR